MTLMEVKAAVVLASVLELELELAKTRNTDQ